MHFTSHFCLQSFVHTAAVQVPVQSALSMQANPHFDAGLQVMSHFDESLHAMLHVAPGAQSSAQSLLSAQVSVHGDWLQVKRHFSVPVHVHAAPHSPVVAWAPTPASLGVLASTALPASTMGVSGEPASEARPSPTFQSYEQPTTRPTNAMLAPWRTPA